MRLVVGAAALVWACRAGAAAAPQLGPAARQLLAAAEEGAAGAGRWSDGALSRETLVEPHGRLPAPIVAGFPQQGTSSVLPPSPSEVGAKYSGFTKGFAVGFTAVEWVPNLVANALPIAGEVLGAILGLCLAPLAVLAGAIGGAVSLLISR